MRFVVRILVACACFCSSAAMSQDAATVFVYRAFERDVCPSKRVLPCNFLTNAEIDELRSKRLLHRIHQTQVKFDRLKGISVPLGAEQLKIIRRLRSADSPQLRQMAIVILEWREPIATRSAFADAVRDITRQRNNDEKSGRFGEVETLSVAEDSKRIEYRLQPFSVRQNNSNWQAWNFSEEQSFVVTLQSNKLDKFHLIDPEENFLWSFTLKGSPIVVRFIFE